MTHIGCAACEDYRALGYAYCGQCGSPVASKSVSAELLNEPTTVHDLQEVEVEQMAAADYLLIETRNSSYRFTALEPGRRAGLLAGQSLGHRPMRAQFVGSLPPGGGAAVGLLALRVGVRAIFYMEAEGDGRHMITSHVTRLTHIRGGRPTGLIAPVPEEGLPRDSHLGEG